MGGNVRFFSSLPQTLSQPPSLDIILAATDVEGNFLAVKAYNYTTLLSCELLDAWAIPSCLFFSWLYMRTRYRPSQLLGVLVCVGGLGMLVASDELTDKDYPAANRGLGDAFMVIGATLYGFSTSFFSVVDETQI